MRWLAVLLLLLVGCDDGPRGRRPATSIDGSAHDRDAGTGPSGQPKPPTGAPIAAAPDVQELTVVSYNVLASKVFPRLRVAALSKILAESDADIIALQEVSDWILTALADEPWFAAYNAPQRKGRIDAPGGQLILSKRPLARTHHAVLTGRQRRTVVVAEIRYGARTLAVATTHMESFLNDQQTRGQQLTEIFGVLSSADDALLTGDLNFGDGEQPATSRIPPSYVDAWLDLHPDDAGFTWHNEDNPLAGIGAFVGEPNRRLDRILMRSPGWHPTTIAIIGNHAAGKRKLTRSDRTRIEMPDRASDKSAEPMIDVFPSDHYGLSATFTWK